MSAVDGIIEIIGGSGGAGGLNEDVRSNVDGDSELKLPNVDPEIAIHVYGGVSIGKVIFACLMWFWYYEMGNSTAHPLEKSAYRAWFSGFLAIMLSWGPVMLFYFLHFITTKNEEGVREQVDGLRKAYLWICMLSVDGPMLMYALPLVFTIIGYLSDSYQGFNVTSPIHFWMGWTFHLLLMVVSFTF